MYALYVPLLYPCKFKYPGLPGTLNPIPTEVAPDWAARIFVAAALLEQLVAVLHTDATFQPVPGVIVSN